MEKGSDKYPNNNTRAARNVMESQKVLWKIKEVRIFVCLLFHTPTMKIPWACREGSREAVWFCVLSQIMYVWNTVRKSGVWGFDSAALSLNWNYCSRTIQTAQKVSGVFAEKGTVLPRGFLYLSIFKQTPYLRLSKMQTNEIYLKNSQEKRVLLRVLPKAAIFQRPDNLSGLDITQEWEVK